MYHHPGGDDNSSNSNPYLPIVTSAKGCELVLADGTTLVDGMSSWWACIHGYNHPQLNQAAIHQIQNHMSHVMFGGLTHEPAAALAKELISIMPHDSSDVDSSSEKRLDKIFYCDSGSVAIEVAMKMALQYWYNQLRSTKRHKFLTVKGGYHGDTFHAMSVCDPVNGMHHLFQSMMPQQIFCERPKARYNDTTTTVDDDVQVVRDLLHKHHEEVAAVILEPIVQGAGGMHFYSPLYLQRVRELCDEYGILLICDEIATGFGRTGKMFAVEHTETVVVPDILCIGKALSGGMMSFAATITSPKVASAFTPHHEAPVLMHGPTFMGNPLACAVSLASLQLLQSYDWKRQVAAIERQMKEELEPCRDSPLVEDVRVLGAIGVVQMKDPIDMKTVQRQLVQDEGVWLRPFGRLLYTMPPFLIQKEQLRKITRAMVSVATRRKV
jgi:adenosylmethionine-8-amino-7-oxononanoate aminotransferase